MQFRYLFAFLLFFFYAKSFAQNDCTDALVVCGNTGFNGLSAIGVGIQELNGSNNCDSQENNSIWLKIAIDQGGTLGFTLTPESTNIGIDFDFFIFGPNVTCDNIGQAIRCSTTNPQASGATTNSTGLNATETDVSEGPGQNGNNFLQWLTVNNDDTYFLVIDRPIGSSNFSLTWTGAATFKEPPVFDIPTASVINLEECDSDAMDDQSTEFNLAQNTPIVIGAQTNVAVTYHLDSNDALTAENPISNPAAFTNAVNPQTIYTRITDTITGCFNTTEFTISVINTVAIPGDVYEICDDNSDGNDTNGFNSFDLNAVSVAIMGNQDISNLLFRYYASNADAVAEVNPLPFFYTNASADEEVVFIKVTNPDNCSKIKQITLKVNALPEVTNASLTQCDPGFNPDGITLFNLAEATAELTNNDSNLTVSFFLNGVEINSSFTNTANPQQIEAVVTNSTTGCSSTSIP